MKQLNVDEVKSYVEKNIGEFHKSRLDSLEKLKLKSILKRKNPYLFKAKNLLTAHDLVKIILDAHLSSQEETIFGDFLEGLAIFINKKVFGGQKSTAEGIDLDFEKDGVRYLIAIKSGPNWGNSSQINKMQDNFIKAKRILHTSKSKINIIFINGCCYGQENSPNKGDYFKYCGQEFWELISGNEDLYTELIEPIGFKAKEKNDTFLKKYSQIINKFTFEFSADFCINHEIDWAKLVEFNSAKE